MNTTLRKLKLLGRTELTLAELAGRRGVRGLVLGALAVGLALLALLALDVGAFFLLAERTTHATSAFLVAAANAVLAALFVLVAKLSGPSREEQMARELRDFAREELNHDLEQLGSVFSGGVGLGSSLTLLAPLTEWLIGLLRKRRKQ